MTGPKGNSEFCFPETLIPRGEAEGNIKARGGTKLTVSRGPVIKCFVIPKGASMSWPNREIIMKYRNEYFAND